MSYLEQLIEIEAEQTQNRILALIDAAAGMNGDRLASWNARRELAEVRRELCKQLAASRGWRLAQTPFSIDQLRLGRAGRYTDRDHIDACRVDRHIDHAEYFRWPMRPYRPAAILTHSYVPEPDLVTYAAEHHIAIETLPWSWYYPGECAAAILTRRRNVFRIHPASAVGSGGPEAA